jgi:hypothetical protein
MIHWKKRNAVFLFHVTSFSCLGFVVDLAQKNKKHALQA